MSANSACLRCFSIADAGEADVQSRPLTTSMLQKVLEKATGLPGKLEEGGGETTPRGETLSERASIKFPKDQVRTVDRVNMWVDAGIVYLRMWPAEIQTQYAPFYSNPTTVEAVIAPARKPIRRSRNRAFATGSWNAATPTRTTYPV